MTMIKVYTGLTKGFREGFSLGYQGDIKVRRTAQNLKLHVGNETILWKKVMKEIKDFFCGSI